MNAKSRKILQKIYFDPSHPAGFSTTGQLWKAAEKKIPKMLVQQWLESQDAYTLHRPLRKRFDRNIYIVNYIDDVWQSDLCDLQSLSKFNDNYKYLFILF